MGIAYVHAYAHNTDLSTVPAENITTTTNSQQGTTTIYHVPTKQLPLTMPLRQLGVPNPVVDQIDATLRPIIDQAYADPQPRQGRTRPSHLVSAPPQRAAQSAAGRCAGAGAPLGHRRRGGQGHQPI